MEGESARSGAKQGLGKALPNKIPRNRTKEPTGRRAKFGTVVESCSHIICSPYLE